MKLNDNKTNIVGFIWVIVAFISWKTGVLTAEQSGMVILYAAGVLTQAHKTEKGRRETRSVNDQVGQLNEKLDSIVRNNQ